MVEDKLFQRDEVFHEHFLDSIQRDLRGDGDHAPALDRPASGAHVLSKTSQEAGTYAGSRHVSGEVPGSKHLILGEAQAVERHAGPREAGLSSSHWGQVPVPQPVGHRSTACSSRPP